MKKGGWECVVAVWSGTLRSWWQSRSSYHLPDTTPHRHQCACTGVGVYARVCVCRSRDARYHLPDTTPPQVHVRVWVRGCGCVCRQMAAVEEFVTHLPTPHHTATSVRTRVGVGVGVWACVGMGVLGVPWIAHTTARRNPSTRRVRTGVREHHCGTRWCAELPRAGLT